MVQLPAAPTCQPFRLLSALVGPVVVERSYEYHLNTGTTITLGCHCQKARAASWKEVLPSDSVIVVPVVSLISKSRLCHRMLVWILVVGLISKPTPTPTPRTLRARLGSICVKSNLSSLMLPRPTGSLSNSTWPNDRFRRRPRAMVPNFLPHMMSNCSLVWKFGSLANGEAPGAGLLVASPCPSCGSNCRMWMAQAP